jgi:hypothetical protein
VIGEIGADEPLLARVTADAPRPPGLREIEPLVAGTVGTRDGQKRGAFDVRRRREKRHRLLLAARILPIEDIDRQVARLMRLRADFDFQLLMAIAPAARTAVERVLAIEDFACRRAGLREGARERHDGYRYCPLQHMCSRQPM